VNITFFQNKKKKKKQNNRGESHSIPAPAAPCATTGGVAGAIACGNVAAAIVAA
jgi:hypothetical protein